MNCAKFANMLNVDKDYHLTAICKQKCYLCGAPDDHSPVECTSFYFTYNTAGHNVLSCYKPDPTKKSNYIFRCFHFVHLCDTLCDLDRHNVLNDKNVDCYNYCYYCNRPSRVPNQVECRVCFKRRDEAEDKTFYPHSDYCPHKESAENTVHR